MKGHVQDLLKDLQAVETALEDEKEMRLQAEHESLHHEATANGLEVQLRAHQRSDLGVDQQLTAIAADEQGKSQQLATAFKTMFRQQTPARQREIRQQIDSYVKDLEKLEDQASQDLQAHGHLRRVKNRSSQSNSDTSQKPENSFAWGAKSP